MGGVYYSKVAIMFFANLENRQRRLCLLVIDKQLQLDVQVLSSFRFDFENERRIMPFQFKTITTMELMGIAT